MNILFIEDDDDLFEDWESVLEREGYTIKNYRSAEKVIKKIGTIHQFDAFIIDIKLKGKLTGIDALHKIREVSEASAIVLTAATNPSAEAAIITIDPKVHVLSKSIHTPEHPAGILARLKEFKAKLDWMPKFFEVHDFIFKIPGKKKEGALKQDVIRCGRKEEPLKMLKISTPQFIVLRKLLTDHKASEGFGVTTKESLLLALGYPADQPPESLRTQISYIRKILPKQLEIKNKNGGYYFERKI